MDIVDKLIEVTKEIMFRNNIDKVIELNNPGKDTMVFIKISCIEELYTFREKLLKYSYLNDMDKDLMKNAKSLNSCPLYLNIQCIYRKKPYGLAMVLYDKEFVDLYDSSYDTTIVTVEEVIYKWI